MPHTCCNPEKSNTDASPVITDRETHGEAATPLCGLKRMIELAAELTRIRIDQVSGDWKGESAHRGNERSDGVISVGGLERQNKVRRGKRGQRIRLAGKGAAPGGGKFCSQSTSPCYGWTEDGETERGDADGPERRFTVLIKRIYGIDRHGQARKRRSPSNIPSPFLPITCCARLFPLRIAVCLGHARLYYGRAGCQIVFASSDTRNRHDQTESMAASQLRRVDRSLRVIAMTPL
ncbi:hypothetical protein BaRGS_00004032 [Batillaria attramentaria]|uniref:Uncharacterized protein n=1 Tax=Batillaria attramentaria TaxID=370345 RepID=A0ABD0LZ67_9CAEN